MTTPSVATPAVATIPVAAPPAVATAPSIVPPATVTTSPDATTYLSAALPTTLAPSGSSCVPTPPITNDHTKVTCGESGFRQPLERKDLHDSPLSPIPKTYRGVLKDPNWHATMLDEVFVLHTNRTWDLVPCPSGANVASGSFGTSISLMAVLSAIKWWVLHGFSQQPGIAYEETFGPIVKPVTTHTILTLALSQN